MKKKLTLMTGFIVLLSLFMGTALLWAPTNVSTSRLAFIGAGIGGTTIFGPFAPKADSASAASDEGSTVAAFYAPYSAIEFTVWKATTGPGSPSSDSLLVILQTSPDPSDSAKWMNLTDFGGRIMPVGFTHRSYVLITDSTRAIYPFFRVTHDHSPGNVRFAGPTQVDTSRWFLFVRPLTTDKSGLE